MANESPSAAGEFLNFYPLYVYTFSVHLNFSLRWLKHDIDCITISACTAPACILCHPIPCKPIFHLPILEPAIIITDFERGVLEAGAEGFRLQTAGDACPLHPAHLASYSGSGYTTSVQRRYILHLYLLYFLLIRLIVPSCQTHTHTHTHTHTKQGSKVSFQNVFFSGKLSLIDNNE